MEPRAAAAQAAPAPAAARKAAEAAAGGHKRPIVPPQITQSWLPSQVSLGTGESLIYRPGVFGTARVHFVHVRGKIDQWKTVGLLTPLLGTETTPPWNEAAVITRGPEIFDKKAESAGTYAELPSVAARPKSYTSWKTSLKNHIYQHQTLKIWESREFKQISQPEESEGDFRGRLAHLAHEKRDLDIEKLRKRYAPKLARLEERLRKAEVRVDREKSQLSHQKLQTAVSVGATVLGALFGRKKISTGTIGRATTTMRGMGRVGREKEDIARARQEVLAVQEKMAAMEEEFREAAADLKTDLSPEDLELTEIIVRPRKGDLSVSPLRLVWTPWKRGQDGLAEPAYNLEAD
jgi:hypothetical protein